MKTLRAVALITFGAVGMCAWSCWRDSAANRDFEHLLGGSRDVAIVSLDFEGTALNDPASLAYLSDMCRSAQAVFGKGVSSVPYDGSEFGASCEMDARLSTGARIRSRLSIAENRKSLRLLFPIDDMSEGVLYVVGLRRRVPAPLAKVLSQLQAQELE
jgi:hypothetical protein